MAAELPPLLLLGMGQVGKEVVKQCGGARQITATSRNPDRLFELADLSVTPLIMPAPSAEIIEPFARDSAVVVSYPPDGFTDRILAPACAAARTLVYISTTGVYGKRIGTVDDTTPVDSSEERARLRLDAEGIWREHGAVVLRAPGIYGPTSGLHLRLRKGTYRLPEGGGNMISRIHVEDLARIILSCLEATNLSRDTYVVGDQMPCTQLEIITWLCNEMNIAMPESVPLSEVSPTLRGNRAVDASAILSELKLSLRYPTYKEGYRQCLEMSA